MKHVFMMLFVFLLAACGKDSGSGAVSTVNVDSEQNGSEFIRNGYVDATARGETDLLNVTLNEQISISGDRISFMRPAQATDRGNKFSCSFTIPSNEQWTFAVAGHELRLTTSSGKIMNLKRIGSGSDLVGRWLWKGSEDGMRIMRRITFLSDRIIINQDCEG